MSNYPEDCTSDQYCDCKQPDHRSQYAPQININIYCSCQQNEEKHPKPKPCPQPHLHPKPNCCEDTHSSYIKSHDPLYDENY